MLKKFKSTTPKSSSTTPEPTRLKPALEPPSWRKTQRLLKRAREEDKSSADEALN